ncbi:MAG: IS200/IS605 family transposase [Melioribacteraceae bacterium]|jgi:putative transposase|nr:IS200/IS605 family transposase [Melioribacteraceae bacterium]
MSVRSFTKIWLHIIWGTHNRDKILINKELRKEISVHLKENTKEKGIYMRENYVNADHVHALIDLPTNMNLEEVMRLIKGESSSWINKQVNFKFAWGKGYGAFSVSESNINKVVNYISIQEEHHRKKSFTEEYNQFLLAYKIDV